MMESYRRMDNNALAAHEENVITFLMADERFLDCIEDAAEYGYTLSVGIHETYSLETKTRRIEEDGKFPYGYSSEIEVDFIRDGRVAMTAPEGLRGVQMSVNAAIVKTPETLLLRKIELIPYDELIEDGTFFAAIEDILDELEEGMESRPTPFIENEREHRVPEGELRLLSSSELGDGNYVEYAKGAFAGSFGQEDSLYLSRDAALPYRILLAHILGESFTPGGIMTLERSESIAFIEGLIQMADSLEGALLFSDVMSRLEIYEFTPPGNAEQLLTAITLARREEFREVTLAFAEGLTSFLQKANTITLIDIAD